jgi:TonB C terminal
MNKPTFFVASAELLALRFASVASRKRWRMRSLIALAVVLLHLVCLAPVLLAPSVHGEGGAVNSQRGTDAMAYITLEKAAGEVKEAPDSSQPPNNEAGPPATAEADSGIATPTVVAGDTDHSRPEPPAEALQFARYMGQVTARLQAAWHPAPNLIAAAYRCRAHISLDSNGLVNELSLQHCGDQAALLHAVQAAIDKASPLPLRPGSTDNSNELALDFEAELAVNNSLQTRVIPAGATP